MGQQASTSQDKFPFRPIREVQSSPRVPGDFRWSLWDGQDVKDPTKSVSIFCLEPSTHPLAQAFFKRFRSFRHPNILPFNHGITVEEEKKTYIVTERVEPLLNKLDELIKLPDAIPWGIHQITKAVHWLNKDFNLVHGNINLSTVYVTKQGDWKLGGLDLVSSIQEVKDGSALVFKHRDLATNLQWSPEMQAPLEKALPALNESPNSAIDAWLLGCLIWSIYNGGVNHLSGPFDRNRLKDMSRIPDNLKDDYTKLLTGSPRNRLSLDRLLDSAYFETTFVQTCLFLENLMLKDAFEKEKFFKSLPKILSQFPDSMSKYKILPALTTGLDFGSADHHALPIILSISSKLTAEEYKAQITPSVLKWFAAPDRTLRMCLLSNLETIIVHLDSTQISSTIWTPLSQGFTDTVPQLRELTVKSLVLFAPKLSDKIINGDLLKFLAALQVDPIPGIRCNTTVCLGKIAPLLSPSVRQKVLLQAFCRALKDPFPPSRRAALAAMAICHENNFFSPSEHATKVIPSIAPMALDTELQVRQAALQGMTTYLKFLELNSEKMPATAPTDPTHASGANGASSNDSAAGGMLDWALGKVLGSDTNTKATTAPANPSSLSSSSHVASQPKKPSFTPSNTSASSQSKSATPSSKPTPSPSNAVGEVPWGEDDDIEPEAVARPAKLPNLRSNTAKPSTAPPQVQAPPKSTTIRSSSSNDGWGNDDDENDDDWGKSHSFGKGDFAAPTRIATTSHAPNRTDSPSTSASSVSRTTKSIGSMSLKPTASSLSAWDTDDQDVESGWGNDFDTPSTSISRVPKSANSSRFG